MTTGAESLQLFNQLVALGNSLFLSDEDFVTINGVTKPTLKKIYAEFLASINTYPTVAEGLTKTNGTGTDNRFFSVPGTGQTFETRYRNDGGVAVDVGKLLSSVAFDQRVPELAYVQPNSIPIVVNDSGQVIIWLENGKLNGAGLDSTILAAADKLVRSGTYNAALVPLMYNETGQVVCWLQSGRFEAAGLRLTINELIQSAMSGYQPKLPTKFTDGTTLFAYRAKIANALGGSGSARVFFTGDSWTEHLEETARPLSQALYTAYGQAGQGWIGLNSDEGGAASTLSQLLNGAKLVKSGFTLIDMIATESNSLDGHAATATGTAATIAITNLKTEALTWWYKDTDGTFRYRVDGGAWTVVAGGNTGTRKSIEITGLSDAVHSIDFDLTGNTGTVVMYGGFGTRTAAGVEFSKAGNGGSTAVQWGSVAPFVQSYVADLKPDAVVIILGTNDLNQSITKANFKSGLLSLVNAYRTGSPNCSVVLLTPVRAGSTTDLGLIASYAEAMTEISQEVAGVEFLNMNAFMPPRITSDAFGIWKDALHLNEAGGRFVTGLLMKHFLRTN